MKLCLSCYQELFDSDLYCFKCMGVKLLDEIELISIKKELISTDEFKREELISNSDTYMKVYHYLEKNMGIDIGLKQG